MPGGGGGAQHHAAVGDTDTPTTPDQQEKDAEQKLEVVRPGLTFPPRRPFSFSCLPVSLHRLLSFRSFLSFCLPNRADYSCS